jgi:hypothetical protein
MTIQDRTELERRALRNLAAAKSLVNRRDEEKSDEKSDSLTRHIASRFYSELALDSIMPIHCSFISFIIM